MVFYHGTVKAYLDDIMKEGLKPAKEHRWFAFWPYTTIDISEDTEPGIYLTREKSVAELFAKSKASYLQTKPGKSFSFFNINHTYPMKKWGGDVIYTSPLVLKVNIPNTLAAGLETDEHGGTHPGKICRCVIEPKFITVEEQ